MPNLIKIKFASHFVDSITKGEYCVDVGCVWGFDDYYCLHLHGKLIKTNYIYPKLKVLNLIKIKFASYFVDSITKG